MIENYCNQEELKKYSSAFVMLVALCSLAISGRANLTHQTEDVPGIPSVAPTEFEPVRASVVDHTPAHFTIDVHKLANIGTDEDAPVFAIYTTSTLPDKCGDFRDIALPYWKPSQFKRTFDLRDHREVIKAMRSYGCVVLKNISTY